MNILDLLDEEADRIEYDTMMPSSSQVRGAENLYHDRKLLQELENKVESHFVIASVNLPADHIDDEDDDSGIEDIVGAIHDMSSKLSTAISNINLNFSERFEQEQDSRTETISYLEKIYELHRDEFQRQERERLMNVNPDIDRSGIETTSPTFGVNPFQRDGNQDSDSSGFDLPSYMDFGGKDKDRDKDNKNKNKNKNKSKSKWFSRAKDFGKHAAKNKYVQALTLAAATAGTAYAFMSGDDEAATPTANNKPVDDPWNYGETGKPLTRMELVPKNLRERVELERIEKWKQRGAPEVNVAVPDNSSKPVEGDSTGSTLAKLAVTSTMLSPVAGPMLGMLPNPMDWIGNDSPKALPSPKTMPDLPETRGKLPAPSAKPSMLSKASSALKPTSLLGKANVIANVGLGAVNAYDIYNDDTLSTKDKTVELSGVAGSVGGGMAGAAAGAAIGSVVPVVGTVIGGVVGGIAGSMLGEAGMETLTDSIYSWFDDDEAEKKAAETAAKPVDKVEQNLKEVSEETDEELVTRINNQHKVKMQQVEDFESAEAAGATQVINGNTRTYRENGVVKTDTIDRTLSNISKKIRSERSAYVSKLQNPLKGYAKANKIPDSVVDNVLASYGNPALTFSDATIISKDMLSDSEFNPDEVIAQFQAQGVSNPTDFSTVTPVSNFVAQTSYPVSTRMDSDSSRENFVEVREVKTESQYDKAAEVAKNQTAPKPEVNKSKPQKPKTVVKTVQAPLSISLIDNLGNQAGFNYVGTTYG